MAETQLEEKHKISTNTSKTGYYSSRTDHKSTRNMNKNTRTRKWLNGEQVLLWPKLKQSNTIKINSIKQQIWIGNQTSEP